MDQSNEKAPYTAKDVFPVIRSLLAPRALQSLVAANYQIGAVRSCSLLVRGLNDTHHIHTDAQPYILRVYRARWRTEANLVYELNLLRYLGAHRAAVATPITRKDGTLASSVEAPEGQRHLALFTYASGRLSALSTEYAAAFGHTVAVVHSASEGFSDENERFALDLDHLVREPLRLA